MAKATTQREIHMLLRSFKYMCTSTVSVTVKYDPLESFSCGRVSTLIILETQNDWTNDQFPRRSTILQILKVALRTVVIFWPFLRRLAQRQNQALISKFDMKQIQARL